MLEAKLFINGHILVKTGIAIGGDKSSGEIGGIDNAVIKNSQGVPYIPGSSIKGKMRSLLEKAEGQFYLELRDETGEERTSAEAGIGYNVRKLLGNVNIAKCKDMSGSPCACGKCSCCRIFGTSARDSNAGPTRLYVRDARMNKETYRKMQEHEGEFSRLELDFTESKIENTIDRITSKANPRTLERVPAGAVFDFFMVYNIYGYSDIDMIDDLFVAMALLEDDYLGAHGSRGYGQIEFCDISIKFKTIDDYRKNVPKQPFNEKPLLLKEIELNALKDKLKSAVNLYAQGE
jgi:CRISPR-associated protein Csm3